MCTRRVGMLALLCLSGLWGAGPRRAAAAEPPLVVFDVPFSVECRDVTPAEHKAAYQRKFLEAVFKISPQVYSGDEADVKRLRYEISTEQQMPVVAFLPNSELATDVAGGTIAIHASQHYGNLSFRYLITPAMGNGELRGDLQSSRAQYSLLAPKQVLLAAGTIDRGCGVFYEVRASTQDTLQRQREFACLFDVPKLWRADYVTIRCKARGIKHSLGGATEIDCGTGLLCAGLYVAADDEARAMAEDLARQQQLYFRQLAATAREAHEKSLDSVLGTIGHMFAGRVMRATAPTSKMGAAVAASLDTHGELREQLPRAAGDAGQSWDAAKRAVRKMNGK